MPRTKNASGKIREGRESVLSRIASADLQAELERRQSMVGELMQRQRELQEALEKLESEIDLLEPASLNGLSRAGSRPRPRVAGNRGGRRGAGERQRRGSKRPANKMNLAEYVTKVLTKKTMGVADVAKAVTAAGYRSNSSDLGKVVYQTLFKHPDRFKRVGRGQYTAK